MKKLMMILAVGSVGLVGCSKGLSVNSDSTAPSVTGAAAIPKISATVASATVSSKLQASATQTDNSCPSCTEYPIVRDSASGLFSQFKLPDLYSCRVETNLAKQPSSAITAATDATGYVYVQLATGSTVYSILKAKLVKSQANVFQYFEAFYYSNKFNHQWQYVKIDGTSSTTTGSFKYQAVDSTSKQYTNVSATGLFNNGFWNSKSVTAQGSLTYSSGATFGFIGALTQYSDSATISYNQTKGVSTSQPAASYYARLNISIMPNTTNYLLGDGSVKISISGADPVVASFSPVNNSESTNNVQGTFYSDVNSQQTLLSNADASFKNSFTGTEVYDGTIPVGVTPLQFQDDFTICTDFQ